MPTYLLDANTFSYLMAEHESVKRHISSLNETDRIIISVVVRGEIRYGLERMPVGKKRSKIQEKAEKLFSVTPGIPVTEEVADTYGKIKREVERLGSPISENDLWIAVSTLANDAILVSNDNDFQPIGGLTIENWID